MWRLLALLPILAHAGDPARRASANFHCEGTAAQFVPPTTAWQLDYAGPPEKMLIAASDRREIEGKLAAHAEDPKRVRIETVFPDVFRFPAVKQAWKRVSEKKVSVMGVAANTAEAGGWSRSRNAIAVGCWTDVPPQIAFVHELNHADFHWRVESGYVGPVLCTKYAAVVLKVLQEDPAVRRKAQARVADGVVATDDAINRVIERRREKYELDHIHELMIRILAERDAHLAEIDVYLKLRESRPELRTKDLERYAALTGPQRREQLILDLVGTYKFPEALVRAIWNEPTEQFFVKAKK